MSLTIEALRQKILDDLRKVGKRDFPKGMTLRLRIFIEEYIPEIVITRDGRSEHIQLKDNDKDKDKDKDT